MLYFELYANKSFWITLLLSLGFILLTAAALYTVNHYHKPKSPDGTVDEHADPGIPLVLKGLYVGMAIYIIAATYIVATMGIKI